MFRYLYTVWCKEPVQIISTFTSEDFMKRPRNEPVLQYSQGSDERLLLDEMLERLYTFPTDVPIVIGADEYRTNLIQTQRMPFEHTRLVAKYYCATKALIDKAISNCLSVREQWERKSLSERSIIFLKAADLAATKYRVELNAATMLGQGKTIIQAEIDAACEFVDFLRFNVWFALQANRYKPISEPGVHNSVVNRGLVGFVAAISPFNFTAIGGNLCTAPALMGNVVVWKPSSTAILSSYVVFKILREAGLPPGVINFVPSKGDMFGDIITSNKHLAGINFAGSVPTFRRLWKQVATNIDLYKTFPRLVGECGGKNFHFVHESADVDSVVFGTIRAAFEYSGQKCSACSRLYVPQSLWPDIKKKIVDLHKKLTVGSPRNNKMFLSAVIDKRAYDRIRAYIERAKSTLTLKIIAGGEYDSRLGYFIHPTIIECTDTADKIFTEEIFGPVLCVYVYPNEKCDEALNSVKPSTPYRLTGSIFARDKAFIEKASNVLREAVGNFYINDKCTGSVVAQQPFVGAGLSGTNGKAGGPQCVLKWASPLTIKEVTKPLREYRYASMES